MELDLDKARAARAHDAHFIKFGETTFELPPEMSVDAGEMFARGETREGLADLLGPVQVEKFFELKPTVNDLSALVDGVNLPDGTRIPGLTDIYVPGAEVGESSASSPSSAQDSMRSRSPSSASTPST